MKRTIRCFLLLALAGFFSACFWGRVSAASQEMSREAVCPYRTDFPHPASDHLTIAYAVEADGKTICLTAEESMAQNELDEIREEALLAAENRGWGDPVPQTEVRIKMVLEWQSDIFDPVDAYRALRNGVHYSCKLEGSTAEVIPYGIDYREEGYVKGSTLISPGENGLACVTWSREADPVTGEIYSTQILDRTVVREPVNAVRYQITYLLTDPSVSTGEFGWPLPDNQTISSKYGTEEIERWMVAYFSSGFGWRELWGAQNFHFGYDIAAPVWTEIYACDGGVVVFAHYHGSYGYMVRIRHANGMETVYAHQARLAVHDGDIVQKGQLIGYVGTSGSASGPHLHLEFRKDHVICDPGDYLTLPDDVPIYES
ncbi:MAG: peptidoglycan DD-metalloendopeptidase family protein [Clostridia bacterium]|nr:peptidoglycan DD-metalloendopeptidase family protein [Clostridia bacterium]